MKRAAHQNANPTNLTKRLDPNSSRMQLIQSAIRFKSNWVEFGKKLTRVAAEKQYREWGYEKFADYCWTELRIKQNTALKLTNAYFFMSRQEPDYFRREKSVNMPDLDAVGILQKAKADNSFSDEMYAEVRDSALVKGQAASTVARKYKELSNSNRDRSIEEESIEQGLHLIARIRKKLFAIPRIPEQYTAYLTEIEEFLNSIERKDSDG